MKHFGYWAKTQLEIVEVDDELFTLNGWNGEAYTQCWKCKDECTASEDDRVYTLRPVHRYELERFGGVPGQVFTDQDNAVDVIDYDVSC